MNLGETFMKDFINKDMDISLAEKFNIGPGQYSNISVTELPFSIRVINRFRGNGIQTVGDMLSRTENELSKFRGFGANCLKEIEAYCIHLSQENDDSIAHSSFNMKPRVHALVSNNLTLTVICSSIKVSFFVSKLIMLGTFGIAPYKHQIRALNIVVFPEALGEETRVSGLFWSK